MTMIRTFHPVGQGAFYSEEFMGNDGNVVFRVVYDCGCRDGSENQKHGRRIVEAWIDRLRESKHAQIDYLFISHFDFDHVSLLQIFKDKNVKVDLVILPLLTKNEKTFLINLYDSFQGSSEHEFLRRFVEDPGSVLSARVEWVAPPTEQDASLAAQFEDLGAVMRIPSGTCFKVSIQDMLLDWCYIPFNHENTSRGRQLRQAFKAKFGGVFNPDTLEGFPSLMKQWRKGHRRALGKLREVYAAVDGDINENSMTVYSGPQSDAGKGGLPETLLHMRCDGTGCATERRFGCILHGEDREVSGNQSVGAAACVYTGDVDLKVADICEWYKRYWGNVGTIQVPHHGSRRSFCSKPFSSEKGLCTPISCSDKCYYKHPNACVTNALTNGGNYPFRVTESQWIEQMIRVYPCQTIKPVSRI